MPWACSNEHSIAPTASEENTQMQVIIAIALFAQLLNPGRGYIDAEAELVMSSGHYAIESGEGCDDIVAGTNVEYLTLAGTTSAGALNPVGSDLLCYVTIGQQINDTPCAMNDDGVCDIAAIPDP